MDRFWPDAKASVVLLPSGGQGEALLALAGEWTKMGLLAHALWVLPERVSEPSFGPPRITALVCGVGPDGELARVEVDLFEALAREPLDVVRLVKLRSAVPSREGDELQDAIAERVREGVRKSMPMPNPNATTLEQPTELRQATLICAPTEFQLAGRADLAGGEYGVVVVASPEDRSSPWSGDAFVRDDERFGGFTLMHLASVAGLFNGLGTSSFELFRREESGDQSVWISRVFVNAVLSGALGRRTAARVLREAARPDSLLVDASVSAPPVGTAFIPDNLVTTYIGRMVDAVLSLDDGALTDRATTMDAAPLARTRIGIGRQIADFLSFSLFKLATTPGWAGRWFASRTARRMTRSLHTEDGAAVVRSGSEDLLDGRDRTLVAAADLLRAEEIEARAEAAAPGGVAHVRTTPRLWARLRELIFGSLDGSADLSDLGFAPIDGSIPVFGRVSDVLALPGSPWEPDRSRVPEDFPARVDWHALALGDPRERLAEWMQEATARTTDARTEQAVREEEVLALEAKVAALEVRTGAADAPEPAAEAAAESEASGVSVRAGEARFRLAEVTMDLARAEADERTRESALQDYDEWASTQGRSFIWRLLHELAAQRRGAQQRSRALSEQIAAVEVDESGELLRLRRRFHLTMLWTWPVVAVAAAVVGVQLVRLAVSGPGAAAARDLYPRLWTAVAVIVGVGIVVTFLALLAYHRGWSRLRRRIEVQRARLTHLAHGARAAREEAARLTSLHRQTVDWLELISRAIHRPWHIPDSWLQEPDSEVERGNMPFAMHVATVPDDDGATARMRGAMTDHLVVRGWRLAAFESFVREVALDRGAVGGSFGLAALDEDLPHSSNHTRQMLRAALDDENLLTSVAVPRLEELVRTAKRDEERGGRPRVNPVGDDPLAKIARPFARLDGDGSSIPWDEFLLGSLGRHRDPVSPISATALAELELGGRFHEKVTSYLVVPQRLRPRLEFDPDAQAEVITVDDSREAAVELSWRVDIAGPVPETAVRLWNERERVADAHLAPAESVASGDSGV